MDYTYLTTQVKLLGTVAAGWPSASEEELRDTVSLDEFLIGNREATYMIKVSGDAMVGAGILPGDIVLVERGRAVKDGDIVLAEVDEQWVMRYLKKQGTKFFLASGNDENAVLKPIQSLMIAAVVTAVVRKYHLV